MLFKPRRLLFSAAFSLFTHAQHTLSLFLSFRENEIEVKENRKGEKQNGERETPRFPLPAFRCVRKSLRSR